MNVIKIKPAYARLQSKETEVLAITRKVDESVIVSGDIKITVVEISGNRVRLGISCPKDLSVYREEVYLKIQKDKANESQS